MKNKILIVLVGIFILSLVSADNSTGFQNIEEEICSKTYDHLISYGAEDYNINLLMSNLVLNGFQITEDDLKYWYIDNFDRYCSEKILRTSQPKLVCNEIYWLVTNKGWDYDDYELTKIKDSLKDETLINEMVVIEYSMKYKQLCNEDGVDGRELPERQIERNLRNRYVVIIGIVLVLLLWVLLRKKPTVYKR